MAQPENFLAGKTALVTGGAKRLGRAIVEALAAEGTNVAIHYNSSAAPAEKLADALRAKSAKAWTVQADLGDAGQVARLFDRAAEQAGPIDLLVNNASVFAASGLMDFTPQDLDRNVTINAMAPLLLSRSMARQGRPGAIVNLLDCRMEDYDRQHVAYHLSKRMLHAITQMLALELAPAIRVNGVAPGLILPPAGEDESYLDRLAATNPLNAHGAPTDIARAVVFLCKSEFVTGQVIYVDGGRHLKGNVYG